jgi:hypothetical protein
MGQEFVINRKDTRVSGEKLIISGQLSPSMAEVFLQGKSSDGLLK